MIDMDDDDNRFMDRAFLFANEALKCDEVPVGCVFVYQNNEIAVGRNRVNETKNACRHAELVAIDQLIEYCQRMSMDLTETLLKCTLYVTLEPCIMCASAMHQLHIGRIVYAASNDRFGGLGSVLDVASLSTDQHRFDIRRDNRRAADAIALLKLFYDRENAAAPDDRRKLKKQKKTTI